MTPKNDDREQSLPEVLRSLLQETVTTGSSTRLLLSQLIEENVLIEYGTSGQLDDIANRLLITLGSENAD